MYPLEAALWNLLMLYIVKYIAGIVIKNPNIGQMSKWEKS